MPGWRRQRRSTIPSRRPTRLSRCASDCAHSWVRFCRPRRRPRGLIVNMSDVLFDTAKYTLKPEAREKLSKVSGILLAYPNLKVQVEGYTDNTGGDQYNLTLSARRCGSPLPRFPSRQRGQHHCDRLRHEQPHRRQCNRRRAGAEPSGADSRLRQRNRCAADPTIGGESSPRRPDPGPEYEQSVPVAPPG
jgi:hypothetical protein